MREQYQTFRLYISQANTVCAVKCGRLHCTVLKAIKVVFKGYMCTHK